MILLIYLLRASLWYGISVGWTLVSCGLFLFVSSVVSRLCQGALSLLDIIKNFWIISWGIWIWFYLYQEPVVETLVVLLN